MITNRGHEAVTIINGELLVKDYRNADAMIVNHFGETDPDELARELDRCLSLGVRVAEAAAPTLNVEFVRREFEATTTKQKELLEQARESVLTDLVGALEPMFGSDGTLQRTLRETRQSLEHELKKYSDDQDSRSLPATIAKKVDDAVRESERRMERGIRDALDIADESRGLGRVYRAIQAEKEAMNGRLTELVGLVSAMTARHEERQLSTRKGPDYEVDTALEVARIARLYGDTCDLTGQTLGDAHRKRGDVVVTIDPRLTGRVEVRLTVEIMDRSTGSLKAVLKELDEAKVNRAAQGAIAVLSSRETPAACSQVLQRHTQNRFLAVLEKESRDTMPLEVAYCWARAEAILGSQRPDTVGANTTEVAAILEGARRDLADLERLRTKFGVSRKAINEAEVLTAELEGKLSSRLGQAMAVLATSSTDS